MILTANKAGLDLLRIARTLRVSLTDCVLQHDGILERWHRLGKKPTCRELRLQGWKNGVTCMNPRGQECKWVHEAQSVVVRSSEEEA